MSALLIAGCTGNNSPAPSAGPTDSTPAVQVKPEPEKPATVKIYIAAGYFNDEDLEKLIYKPVREKAPHIKLERREGDVNTLLASGDIPDLTVTHNGKLLEYADLGLVSDLTELTKSRKFDLDRFDPMIINSLKLDGKLVALPYAVNFTALYYNKDIFDKFGVTYPKDGITWSEAIELAKKLTREDAGTKYRGIDPESISRLTRVLGVDSVDYKTNKAIVNNENWRSIFNIYKEVFSIPGNMPLVGNILSNPGYNEFFNAKTLAMYASHNHLSTLKEAEKNGLNWDVAQYPSMPGKPGISSDVDAHVFSISAQSKQKEAAMRVIEIITSDEVQTVMTRQSARVSPLKNTSITSQFAVDYGNVKGKNLAGIFKGRRIEAPIRSKYVANGLTIAGKHLTEYVNGNKDINSALRDTEEEINKFIATQVNK